MGSGPDIHMRTLFWAIEHGIVFAAFYIASKPRLTSAGLNLSLSYLRFWTVVHELELEGVKSPKEVVRNELPDLDCIKTEASQQPGSGLCFRCGLGGEKGVEGELTRTAENQGAKHRRCVPEEVPI